MGDRELSVPFEVQQSQVCPICTGISFQTWKLGLVQCGACGIVLSPSIWRPHANEKLEEEWFGDDFQPQTSCWVGLFERWKNRKTIARLLHAKPTGLRLLEVGVGSGSFLSAARNHGFDVMGCDLSASICASVSRRFGVAMHCEPLSALVGEHRFDVIVMNHVLEHVPQPIAFMEDVRRLLAPGGVAHITVPNVSCWEAALSGWTSFEPYHLTYFNPRTLSRTMSASGLIVEHIVTHESFSGWFLAILRTVLGINQDSGAVIRSGTSSAKRSDNRRGSVVEHIYRLLTVCIGGVLLPVRWTQATLGRGDEVICLARNPNATFS